MKALLSLIIVSAAANLAAGAPPAPMQNDCPCLMPKTRGVMFEVYGEVLFLQPNGSNLYYAAQATPFDPAIAVPAVSPNWAIFEITPNYAPGFKVGGKLHFTDMDTTLEANWERLHTDKHASHTVPISSDMIGPLFDIGPQSVAYTDSTGKGKFHFDSVDLLFGQECCGFKRLYANFYAGAEFALIKQRIRGTYSSNATRFARTVDFYSTFIGAGPKFGLDFDYRICGGFFFTGTTSLGLIIGELKNATTYQSYSSNLVAINVPNPNNQGTSVPNRTQLIPAIEEKLGFSYAALFRCYRFVLGAGYQAQIYINAVQSIDMTAPQVLPSISPSPHTDDGVFAVGFERTLSNFQLTGPYISLSVEF